MKCTVCSKDFEPRHHNHAICSVTCKRTRRVQHVQRWIKNNPEGQSAIALRSRLKYKYGLSLDQYNQMLTEQGGCAICGTTEPGGKYGRFHVDHDHKTGEVRGLLCNGCNVGLGHFRDHPERLNKAAEYLGGRVR